MWSKNVRSNKVPEPILPELWDPKQNAFPFAPELETPEGPSRRFVRFDPNGVYVKLQRGPVREVGVNGAQIDDLLTVGLVFLQKVNAMYPCRENSLAITKLEECLMWLEARTRDREERDVEGQNRV